MEEQAKIEVSCGRCQWFKPIATHKGEAGECRAESPTVLVMPSASLDRYGRPLQSEINVCFPTVPASLWCGRFAPLKVHLYNDDEAKAVVSTESEPSKNIVLG